MFTAATVSRKISVVDNHYTHRSAAEHSHRSYRPRTPRKLSNALQTLNETHKDGTAGINSTVQELLLQQQQEQEQFKNSFNISQEQQSSYPPSRQSYFEHQYSDEEDDETYLERLADVGEDSELLEWKASHPPIIGHRPRREAGVRVRINVSGKVFETYEQTLTSKPGSIFKLKTVWNYFDPVNLEFYFDRDPKSFAAIFTYMQCGLLIKPDQVLYRIFIEDLQFFGFGDKAREIYDNEIRNLQKEVYDEKRIKSFRDRLWYILEYPHEARLNRILNIFSTLVVFVSIVLLCVETIPTFKETQHVSRLKNACVGWFTFETTLKFLVSKNKLRFFTRVINLLDISSLIPFYVYLLRDKQLVIRGCLLRVFRLAPVIDSLGLPHSSKMLRIVLVALKTCVKETLIIISIFTIAAMLFSTLIYSFEHDPLDEENPFDSIPAIMWFCIVTMTTVGYGEIYPQTTGGKAAGSLLVTASILVISLPLPLLIGNFLSNYTKIKKDPTVDGFFFDEDKCSAVEKEEFQMQGWWEEAVAMQASSTSLTSKDIQNGKNISIKDGSPSLDTKCIEGGEASVIKDVPSTSVDANVIEESKSNSTNDFPTTSLISKLIEVDESTPLTALSSTSLTPKSIETDESTPRKDISSTAMDCEQIDDGGNTSVQNFAVQPLISSAYTKEDENDDSDKENTSLIPESYERTESVSCR